MFFRFARPRWARLSCIAVGLSSGLMMTAGAGSPDAALQATGTGEPLTLAQAIDRVLKRNPDLAAGAYELSAADARITQARLRPNPELSADLENFAGSGDTQGTDALEATLSLSQVIELGGKRARRTDFALRDRDLATIERRAAELDVLAEATRRFIAVVAAQERRTLASAAQEIARKTLETIDARVRAARSPLAERSRSQIALTRADIEAQQAQSELESARWALAALWTDPSPQFGPATADLFALEPVQPFESLVGLLERNPDFIRFATEARLRDAELHLARAQARPDLTFGIGVRRLNDSGDTAMVAGFSMPLPVHNRNQGTIREAEIRVTQNRAMRDAAFARARATVHGLYQELTATRKRVEALRGVALHQAQEALEQSQYGYERGRFSFLELLTAQQELLELRAAVIDAATDYHQLLAELERITSEPLTGSDPEASLP